jgi:hypothetical protein
MVNHFIGIPSIVFYKFMKTGRAIPLRRKPLKLSKRFILCQKLYKTQINWKAETTKCTNLNRFIRWKICLTKMPEKYRMIILFITLQTYIKHNTISYVSYVWKYRSVSWFRTATRGTDATEQKKNAPWLLVRKRTIPTERPPLLGEVSANFCG